MADSTFINKLGAVFRNQKRAPKISLNCATILANQKLIHGIITIIVAILIASWSYNLSVEWARNDWESSNPPPLALWDQQLAGLGFTPVLNEKAFIGLTRGLVSNQERAFGATLNIKLGCLALFGVLSESFPSRLYCRPFAASLIRENHASTWESLGFAWEGYRTALAALKSLKPLASGIKPKYRGKRVDPREIEY